MGDRRFFKPEPETVRGICVECGKRPQKSQGFNRLGIRKYSARCNHCIQAQYDWRRKHRAFKGTHCAHCGFWPRDPCQLDVDHINGNRRDVRPENLQTLCANCHRLKTKDDRQAGRFPSSRKGMSNWWGSFI